MEYVSKTALPTFAFGIFPKIIELISIEPEKRIYNDIADMEKEIQREMH